jgi:hypothetical protein
MKCFPESAANSLNPELTLETLRLTHDRWDYDELIDNYNFDWSWVVTFPDKPWAWDMMHLLQSFQWTWIEEFPDKNWNWFDLRPPLAFLAKFAHKPFNWRVLSMNKTIDDIQKYPDLPWDWEALTIYSDISTDYMIRYDFYPWDVETLSFTIVDETIIRYIRHFAGRFNQHAWIDFSGSVTFSVFKDNMDLDWQTEYIRFHEIVNEDDFMNIILAKGFRHWNWKFLSRWVDAQVIKKCNMFPWQEFEIIHNTTLCYDDLCSFHTLGNHPRAPCESLESVVLQWHSACVIQRAWRTCTTHPEYALCKRQIADFLEELHNLTT